MKNEALVLELINDMTEFINDFVDEYSSEGTVSHDTFNKAVEMKYRIIADSDLCDGTDDSDTESGLDLQRVSNNEALESSSEGVAVCDHSDWIKFANKAICRSCGETLDE